MHSLSEVSSNKNTKVKSLRRNGFILFLLKRRQAAILAACQLILVGLTGLDSNKCKAILQYKCHIGSQENNPSVIILPEKPKNNKRIDEFGEVAVSYLQKPFRTEFSEQDIDEIISGYKAGKTTPSLAEQFNCSKTTITALLRRHGVTVTRYRARAKLDPERVIIMYKHEQTMKKIASCFGVSTDTIRKCLLENNVKIRSRWDYIKE